MDVLRYMFCFPLVLVTPDNGCYFAPEVDVEQGG